MRIGAKHILWFFVKFLIVFCVLVLPQASFVGRAYSAAYCGLSNVFLGSFGGDGMADFETVREVRRRIARHQEVQVELRETLGRAASIQDIAAAQGMIAGIVERDVEISRLLDAAPRDEDWDVVMHLGNKRTQAYVGNVGSCRLKGYVPTAFVVSLILATPIPWKRRLRALVLGLFAVSAFVGLRLYVFLVHMFTQPPEKLPNGARLAVYEPWDWLRQVIGYLEWVLDFSFAGCFVLAGVIWFLVTFRKSDWAPLFGSASGGATRSASGDADADGAANRAKDRP